LAVLLVAHGCGSAFIGLNEQMGWTLGLPGHVPGCHQRVTWSASTTPLARRPLTRRGSRRIPA